MKQSQPTVYVGLKVKHNDAPFVYLITIFFSNEVFLITIYSVLRTKAFIHDSSFICDCAYLELEWIAPLLR